MLSLACLAVALLPTPAHAGHWVLKLDGSSGSASANGTPVSYTPPTGTVSLNPITVIGPSASGWFSGSYSFGTPPSYSATATLTIVLTGTWTADTNSDNTPPPSLMFSVSSSATGYYANNGGPLQAGQANDGFGDPFDPKAQYPGTSDTLTARFKSLDPKTLSLTLTLTASATGGPGAKGGGGANASIGTVTLAIHAQPYHWRDAGYNPSITLSSPDTTPGGYADYTGYRLIFRYKWSSTDGNLGDLNGIDIYEYVVYTGNSGTFGTDSSGPYYRPTSPPIAPDPNIGDGTLPYELGNPEISHATPTTGATFDIHSVWPTKTPYSVLTVTAPQKYEFNDSATGEKGTVLFDAGNIQEGVSLNPSIFYIKKSGAHVEKPLP